MDKVSTIVLASSLIIIMLGMGLSLVVQDFKRVLLQPKAIILGLVNQLIILPLVGFGLCYFFNLPPVIAVGVIILAACPGGPTSNLIAHLAKADTALSVSLTAVSSLITIVTIPFIVNYGLVLFTGTEGVIQLDVPKTIIQIFAIVIIPVSIGMLIRHTKKDFAEKMNKPVKTASAIVLALVIVGIIVKEKSNFASYFQQAGWVTFALNGLTMGLGYLTARVFKLNKAQALSISIESGIQNGTMAISIATVLLANSSYAIAPAVYSLIMFATGGLLIFIGNKKTKKVALA